MATLYREEEGENWDGDTHNLLYIREDYLRRYLGKTRQTFVWCNWGERGWADKGDLHSQPRTLSDLPDAHAHPSPIPRVRVIEKVLLVVDWLRLFRLF